MSSKALPLAYRQVHLDFHTSEHIPDIGAKFDPKKFAADLEAAHVNSITCFSRCHHGLIYHDTKFPARHPHLTRNLLKEQIDACHARGIRVPIYITVGFDEYMAQRHPEWIELQADGKIRGAAPLEAGWRKMCLNTPYVDYVLEQTIEVLDSFPTDGLFFDIIHQGPCCCRWCMAGMASEGIDPEDEAARHRYSREVLHRLRRRFKDEIRRRNEDCLIFWNSGHTDPGFRPTLDTWTHLELESLPSGGWGYDHFPLTVRYARNLGKDHLGMTGKFIKTWAGFGEFKNPAALEYECFTALAEGSKVSIGDQLHPDGRLNPATLELIRPIYAEVEKREPWCAGSTAVTEIAIFNPEAIGVHDGRVDTSAGGAHRMLVEAHYQHDVVDAEMDWSRYQVLILPDKIRLDEALTSKVRDYVASGGKLIASHHSGLASDRDEFVVPELGVRYLAEARHSPDFIWAGASLSTGIPDAAHVAFERGIEVEATPDTEILAEVWWPYFDRNYAHFCSHRHSPEENASGFPAAVSTGNTVYFAHPLFASFMRHGVLTYKRLVLNALKRLLPDPLIVTNAPSTARISLQRQAAAKRTVAHVLHYIPEQRYREIQTIEEPIPLYHVDLDVRLDTEPRRVYLAPEATDLPFRWENGRATVTVPQIRGSALVVFQE